MMSTTRRFPPLRPGDTPRCPNGCSEYEQGAMPDRVPSVGYWGISCMTCNWVAILRPRYGDRPHDLFFVVDENVPPDLAAHWRAQTADLRRRHAAYNAVH